jgi:hypothetical protein
MSAPALTVDRLTATVRLDGHDDGAGRRVDTLLREVAGARLPRAWSAVDVPPGHWCLRRLRLDLEMGPGRGDLELSERWAHALVAGIGAAVRQGSAEVVHYRRRLDALTDAVAQLAVGRPDRAWAWAQVGVLAPGGPDPVAAPGAAALAALLTSPEQIVPALVTAARRCGMAALDRAVGTDGWRQLAQRAWETAGGRPAGPLPAPKDPASGAQTAEGLVPVGGGPAGAGPAGAGPAGAAAALSAPPAALAGSELAATIGRSRLVPTGPVLDAWAVLAALELDPVLPRRPAAAQRLGRVRAALAAASPTRSVTSQAGPPAPAGPATPATPVAPPAPGPVGTGPAPRDVVAGAATTAPAPSAAGLPPAAATTPGPSPRPAAAEPGAASEAPADPGRPAPHDGEPPSGRPTDWAGLPFLLATAAAAGLPDRLLDAPAFGARPLAWCVHAVGQTISGARGDDPGLLALAGLHGARAAAVAAAPPPSDAERAALDQVARDWAAVTAARLLDASTDPAADGRWTGLDPGELVARLVRRAGHVIAEPGWIEVHLPLDGVDLTVRRAGLDADPGWVDWLGTVVRFVYA